MMSKITDELKKYKNAAASEVKETRLLVKILMSAAKEYKKDKNFKLDDEDVEFIKDQSQDILKLIPLIVVQILPGGTIATPFIVELSKKLGIKLNSKIPKKHQEEKNNGEIDELVNADGSMIGKSIPMLDQGMHPRKTMDQTISAARITNDPISRGYRTYYGESEVKEIDMSGAFGYEETKDMDGCETYKYFVKELGMEKDEAKDRVSQQGKDWTCKKDEKSEYSDDPNFITRATLSEIQKQKAIKVVEDMLAKKKDSADLSKKDSGKDTESLSPVLKKNLSSLIKQAEKHGFSKKDLIKIIQSE